MSSFFFFLGGGVFNILFTTWLNVKFLLVSSFFGFFIMRRHIFADEAGCLTFEHKRNVSRYFILCTIATDTPDIGTTLTELRRELAWQGLCEDAFHATSDLQEIRDSVFSIISGMDFRIDATILEKTKALPRIRETETQFYQYAWYYHFKHVAPLIVSQGDELHLTAASIGTKKQRGAFTDSINNVTRQTLSSAPCNISFWPAASDPCLQIADYCAWAVQRKWERNDTRSYDLISDKISTEYELWRKGTTHYY
ncbi:MAG: DUF3800 domain-containing protein [Candidatus Thiodiazotropha sp. (ex Ctena orbiculata)]|nr:DUF3800 domain-containing protein [Candidatus Thiodiazotropha taylori]